ncbi:MAG: DUF2203 domain-containing protein [Candidatus Nealsonbacteria bacterium]|nr:DUF2203 domain-containing protein [Candidatus Nealsonbacteria bacterium]
MVADPNRPRRVFTVDEANAALPLVRAIVSDLAEVTRELLERRQRLSLLIDGRDADADDPYRAELLQVGERLEEDGRCVRQYVEELLQLGVEPTSGPEGLVDFPSMMDGRPVYLCWKLGEPEVLYWHERDAGFRERQPLPANVVGGRRGAHGRTPVVSQLDP